MGNSVWTEKLKQALARYLHKSEVTEIMAGCEQLQELDEVAQAECMKGVMERIDARIPDEDTKMLIMRECSCRCYEDDLEELKNVYRTTNDFDSLIDAMYGKVFLNKPEREGDTVYITKAPRFPEEHQKAATPQKKQYYFCHCDYARAVTGNISLTYCYCGAGWCRNIWEAILERPVRVEIVKSVLQGDDVCRFAVHL
jgi:hypothetical protein